MKLILLDYFRRKGLVLLVGAIVEFIVGMFSGGTGAEHIHPLGTLQIQISIFMGAFLLSMDLQRGIARTMASLPVTVGQIARAWWFATVGITSVIFATCLFAGAVVGLFIHSGMGVDWEWVALAAAFLFLWMGSTFTLIIFVSKPGYYYGSGWQRITGMFAALLWASMLGGGVWLFQDLESHPARMTLMLVFGASMTAIGWFGAEKFVSGRAGFKVGALAVRRKQGPWRLQGGYGGIPYLMSTTCLRAMFIGLAMVTIIALVFWMQGSAGQNWRDVSKELLGMGFFPFWFIIFFSYVPLIMQLRFLRSLPISPTVLSMIMMTVVVLPLLVLGAIMVAIAGPFLGTATALNLAGNFVLTLPISIISLVLTLWLGYGRLSFLLMFALIFAFQALPPWLHVSFRYQQIPLTAGTVISVASIIVGWLLIRLLLARNSKVYRIAANAFGNSTWWQGR